MRANLSIGFIGAKFEVEARLFFLWGGGRCCFLDTVLLVDAEIIWLVVLIFE